MTAPPSPRIIIADLPPGDVIPQDTQEQIVGAGRLNLTRLGVEALEQRQLLAAGVTASMSVGVLRVIGTEKADKIRIESVGTNVKVFSGNRQILSRKADAISEVKVIGFGGNDTIDLRGYHNSPFTRIHGGKGNDVIWGGAGRDHVFGDSGNDVIHGNQGDDRLFGESGNDKLYGGKGDDWLDPGSKGEFVRGGEGVNWNPRQWIVNGLSKDDIHQGGAATCVFLSSLISAAQRGVNLANRITYLGNYKFTVMLYNKAAGEWQNIHVEFDGKMVQDSRGGSPDAIAEGKDEITSTMEFWTIVYQRAYLKMIGYNPMSADSVYQFNGESTERPMKAVLGPNCQWGWENATGNRADLQSRFDSGEVLIAWTHPAAADVDRSRFYAYHVYAIVKVETVDNVCWVTVRDPYRQDSPLGESAPKGQIVVRYTDFVQNFGGYAHGVVRSWS